VGRAPDVAAEEEAARRATVHRDPSGWGGRVVDGEAHGAHLPELRRAVLAGVQVDLEYARPGGTPTWRRVHPLGLVLKRDVWYLLAATNKGNRTYRVSRVSNAMLTEEPVTRPEDFDLATAWGEIAKSYTSRVGTVAVRLRVEVGEEEQVALMLGSWIPLTPAGADEFDAHFPNETVAAAELIRLGRRVEVIGPASVRARLADAGRELIDRYEEP
jgi:predicted DNA-binding transcriptional regulator YafY